MVAAGLECIEQMQHLFSMEKRSSNFFLVHRADATLRVRMFIVMAEVATGIECIEQMQPE